MELLDEKASDVSAAKRIKYNKSHHSSVKKERRNFLAVRSSSIFGERSTKQKALLKAAERKAGVAATPSTSTTSSRSKNVKKSKSNRSETTTTTSEAAPIHLLTNYLSD